MKKKTVKRIVVGFAVTLLSLVSVAGLLGYLFRDRIHEYVMEELGRRLNARIEIDKTHVSFFRSFPDVSVELSGVRINQRDQRQRVDFINVPTARVRVDFWSFFSERYRIEGVRLFDPTVVCIRNRKGNWNFGDVFQIPPDTSKSEADSSMFVMDLDQVRIYGGLFRFEDSLGGTMVNMDSIEVDLGGDLREDGTSAEGKIAFRMKEWKTGKFSLFADKHILMVMHLDALYDEKQKYAIKDSRLQIASVALDLSGKLEYKPKGWYLDLAFASQSNNFASFLSLLPGGLLDTGREYEYDGDFNISGSARGMLTETQLPVIEAKYAVHKGRFKYKDYASELKKAEVKGNFNFDPNDGTQSFVVVEEMKASLNEKQLEGRLDYRNFNDPALDLMLFGDLNLKDLQEFYPSFADSSKLEGDVFVDMKAQGRLADFKDKNYNAVKASGRVDMTEVSISDPRVMHPITNLNGSVSADNQRILVSSLFGKVGSSDFDITGTISNYLPWIFASGERLSAEITMKSGNVNLNDWLEAPSGEGADTKGQEELYQFKLPEAMDVSLSADMGHFELAGFTAEHVKTKVSISPDALVIHNLNMETQSGTMAINGRINILSPEMVEVNITNEMKRIDMHQAFNTFQQLAAFALVKDNLYGTLTEGTISLKGRVNNKMELLSESIVMPAKGHISGGRLKDYKPMEALAGFIKVDKLRDIKFSDIDFDFRIENEQFIIPRMKLQALEYKMEVEGRHGFDNSLHYRLWVELPGKEARTGGSKQVMEWIETDPENQAKIRIVLPIIVTGTVDEPVFKLDMKEVMTGVVAEIGKQGDQLQQTRAAETEYLFGEKDTAEVSDWIIEEKRDSTKKGGWPKGPKLKNPFKKNTPK